MGAADGPRTPAEHGLGSEPGAQLLPAADTGSVGVVEVFGRDALDAGCGVSGQPAVRDGGVGGGREQYDAAWQASVQQRFQGGALLRAGVAAQVLAAVGEQVEHHARRRGGGGEVANPGRAGAQPVLQRGEVQPPGPSHHHPVHHHPLALEGGEGGGEVGKRCGQRTLLARLQHHPGPVAERQRPTS
jgi:hypothetical protein